MTLIDEDEYIRHVAVDCVILGFHDRELKVLITKYNLTENFWALPGGFIKHTESTNQAVQRVLEERTGLTEIYLEQFHVSGEANRPSQEIIGRVLDQQGIDRAEHAWLLQRFIAIGYYALVDFHKVIPTLSEIDESIDWYDIKKLPPLAFDHAEMITAALDRLRLQLDHKLVGFNLLPETFTIRDIQDLYETVLDKPLRPNNFQKKILDMNVLERLEKKFTGAANKAPYLYRFK